MSEIKVGKKAYAITGGYWCKNWSMVEIVRETKTLWIAEFTNNDGTKYQSRYYKDRLDLFGSRSDMWSNGNKLLPMTDENNRLYKEHLDKAERQGLVKQLKQVEVSENVSNAEFKEIIKRLKNER